MSLNNFSEIYISPLPASAISLPFHYSSWFYSETKTQMSVTNFHFGHFLAKLKTCMRNGNKIVGKKYLEKFTLELLYIFHMDHSLLSF